MGALLGFVLLILTALSGQGQGQNYPDIRKCLFDFYFKELPNCPDLQGAIRCIQRLPVGDTDQNKLKAITESLSLLYRESQESWCPKLTERGSCIWREISDCHDKTQSHFLLREAKISKLCSATQHYQTCLVNLTSLCDNEALRFQIKEEKKTLKSCDSGVFRSYIDHEQCYCGIDRCNEDYMRALDREQYSLSCKLIPSVIRCYNSLKATCHGDYLQRVLSALVVEEVKCNKGFFTGEDTKDPTLHNSIQHCTAEFNQLFRQEAYTQACSKVVSVGQCLEKLRPSSSDHVNLRTVISDIMRRCSPKYLQGVCNFQALYACTEDILGVTSGANGSKTSACTQAKAETANKCLSDLEPYCNDRHHLDVLHDDRRKVYLICHAHLE